MENNWRRQKWDNQRKSQNKRPPRGNWRPTVPSWEKQFCKVVGSMDWETLLQLKKFMHIYENVIAWDDSAVEETFHNAKQRFWAEIKGLPCDIPLPDPDLYIDKIDWDKLEDDDGLLSDFENEVVTSDTEDDHEPVIIFGDSFLPKQAVTGWGDDEENFKVPNNSSFNDGGATGWGDDGENFKVPNSSSFNNGGATGWGDYGENFKVPNSSSFNNGGATGWGDDEENFKVPNNSSFNNGGVTGWGDYPSEGWGSWNDNSNYEVGPGYEVDDWKRGTRNESNGGRHVSRYRGSRVQGNDHYRPRNYEGRHKGMHGGEKPGVGKRSDAKGWDSFKPCGPVSHQRDAMPIRQAWNR
ncbi:hypothetical protein BUALT_Bualt12G0023800 [Buddleja alternifolia]|uniref:Uncharacterized protein n=1 Tax=Buddleja alternifolia TaxID=168488 RepID=A0AAV6WYH5_9LAMI|nr:hypothetical protein BUALT_Bualt12G0023800 [Buddleja alternifolia]